MFPVKYRVCVLSSLVLLIVVLDSWACVWFIYGVMNLICCKDYFFYVINCLVSYVILSGHYQV